MFSISPVTHPHVFGWLCFVGKFNEKVRDTWGVIGAPAPAKGGKGKKDNKKKEAKKEDDDDLDLFGDDNEEDAAAAKAAAEKVKAG